MRRTPALLTAVLLAPAAFPQNAYISQVDVAPYAAAGRPVEVTGYIRNSSGPAVTSFVVSWRWRNGPVQQGTSMNLGPTGLSGESMAMFTHPTPLVVKGGERGTLKVWVEAPGDPDRSNDTVRVEVTGLDRWAPKRQLLEVRTSLACHNCLQAKPRLDEIGKDPGVVLTKFHYRDALTVPAVDAYFDGYATQFTPAGVVDQGEYGGYAPNPGQSQWHNHLRKRQGGAAPVVVWAEPLLDTATQVLHVTVGTEFVTRIKGDFAVNAMIVRNNVHAPWEAGPGDPWNHRVVQVLLGGSDGDGEVVPDEPAVGTTYKITWEVAWPQGIDFHDVCVVALVTHYDRGAKHTLNVQEACVNRGRAPVIGASLPPAPVEGGTWRMAAAPAGDPGGAHRAKAVLPQRPRTGQARKGAPRA